MAKNHAQLDWREERRFRAWHLHQLGWKQRDIATAIGVTEVLLANGSLGLAPAELMICR